MTTDTISEELYQALKSMSESYKIVIEHFPKGVARSSIEGFFLWAPKQAEDAILKYELLKPRTHNQKSEAYMIDIMNGCPFFSK